MALYGQMRDVSMIRFVNRELMQKIISQQCVYYKYNLTTTKVNMYGEAAEGRYFSDPTILFALISREDQIHATEEFGVEFKWDITFKFLKDDLVEANIFPQVGDIIMWDNAYYEIDNPNLNQYFVGKDPQYPYLDDANQNPYETDLGEFGYNVSVICAAHYVPSDRVNIELSRM